MLGRKELMLGNGIQLFDIQENTFSAEKKKSLMELFHSLSTSQLHKTIFQGMSGTNRNIIVSDLGSPLNIIFKISKYFFLQH